jgi:riboflavin transporter FmnP
MAILGSAFNAIYLLPKFALLYKLPLDSIIAMGAEVNANVTNVTTFVMICVAPLNVIKGVMVSIPTMLLYKRVAKPLFGIHHK